MIRIWIVLSLLGFAVSQPMQMYGEEVGYEVKIRSTWTQTNANRAVVLDRVDLGHVGTVTGFRFMVHGQASYFGAVCNISLQIWEDTNPGIDHARSEVDATFVLQWTRNVSVRMNYTNRIARVDLEPGEGYELSQDRVQKLGFLYGQDWGCISTDSNSVDEAFEYDPRDNGMPVVPGLEYTFPHMTKKTVSLAAIVEYECQQDVMDECKNACAVKGHKVVPKPRTACHGGCQCVDVCQTKMCDGTDMCLAETECFQSQCIQHARCSNNTNLPYGYYGNVVRARSTMDSDAGEQRAFIIHNAHLPVGGVVTEFQAYIHRHAAEYETRLYLQVWEMKDVPYAVLKYSQIVSIPQGFYGPMVVYTDPFTVGPNQYLGFTEYDAKGHVSMDNAANNPVYVMPYVGYPPVVGAAYMFQNVPANVIFSVAAKVDNVPIGGETTTTTTTFKPWWSSEATTRPWWDPETTEPEKDRTTAWWQRTTTRPSWDRSTTSWPWWKSTTVPWWDRETTERPWWKTTTRPWWASTHPTSSWDDVDECAPYKSPDYSYTPTGCPIGFYGDYCDRRCNSQCQSCMCTMDLGTCMYGCATGFYGPFCEMECERDYYGNRQPCYDYCQGEGCLIPSSATSLPTPRVLLALLVSASLVLGAFLR